MSVSIHSSIISFTILSLACHISALEYAFFGNRRLRLSPSSPVHSFTTSELKRNIINDDSRKDDEDMITNSKRLLYGKGYSKGAYKYKSKGYAIYGSKGYGKGGYQSKGYGSYKSKGHGKGASKSKGSYKSKGYSKGGYSSKYGAHKSRYYGDTRSARTRSEDSDKENSSNHNRKDRTKNQNDMKDMEKHERREDKRKEREERAVEKERKEREKKKEEKRNEREDKKDEKRQERKDKREEKRKEREEEKKRNERGDMKEEKRKEREEEKEKKRKDREEEKEKKEEQKEKKRKDREEEKEKKEEQKEKKRKEREEQKEKKRKEREEQKDEKRNEEEKRKERKKEEEERKEREEEKEVEQDNESNDSRKSKVKRKSNKKDRSNDYGDSLEDDDSSQDYDYDYNDDYDYVYKHDDTYLSYKYSDDTAGIVENEGNEGGNITDENDSDGKEKSKKKDDTDKDDKDDDKGTGEADGKGDNGSKDETGKDDKDDDEGKGKADGKGDNGSKDKDDKSDEDEKEDGKDEKNKDGVKSKDKITCQERKGGNQLTGTINYKYTMETLVDEVDAINEKLTNAMLIATASDVCQRRRLFESIERHLEVVEVGAAPKDILTGTCKPVFDKKNTCVEYDGKMTVTITDEGDNKSLAETRKNIISTLQFYADNGMFSNIDNDLVSVSVYDEDRSVIAEAVSQDTDTNEVMATGSKVMISMAAICAILASILLLRKRRRKLDNSIEILKDEKEKDSISLATVSTDVTPSRRNVGSPTHENDIDRNIIDFDTNVIPDSPSKRYGVAELEAIEEERSSDVPNYYNLGRIHSSQDVHRCRSGSCLGCQQRQQAKNVQFIPMEK